MDFFIGDIKLPTMLSVNEKQMKERDCEFLRLHNTVKRCIPTKPIQQNLGRLESENDRI